MGVLLAANDGGHLMQLYSLADRLPIPEDRVWVTVATAQSESLLRGQDVLWVGPGPTRDMSAVLRNAWDSRRVFSSRKITHAVSTGSSLALSILPQAHIRGAECYYIESATRLNGPSMSGRLLRRFPGIACYTQYRAWAGHGWKFIGSVFDGYGVDECRTRSFPDRPAVVVSLGTSRTYGFRRLVEKLIDVLPVDSDVLWQTGSTDVSGLGIRARPFVSAQELEDHIRRSDITIAHAGTGIALTALQLGVLPVLVPRDPRRHEHVDDHQQQIAEMLAQRGLAIVQEVDSITREDLLTAMSYRVVRRSDAPILHW